MRVSPIPSFAHWLIAAAFLLVAALGGYGAESTDRMNEGPARSLLVGALEAKGPEQLKLLGELGDSGSKTAAEVLTAWSRGQVYLVQDSAGRTVPVLFEEQQDSAGKSRADSIADGTWIADAKGKEARFDPSDATSVDADMRLRSAIRQTLDMLALSNPDPDERRSAAVKLGASQRRQYIPALQARLAKEKDSHVRRALEESIAQIDLTSADPAVQQKAIARLAFLNAMGCIDNLNQLAAAPTTDKQVAQAAKAAAASINSHIQHVNLFGTIFRGVSLGSILLVVTLGLAITFGQMGVINMAHGEMIAVGAYTCYVVQNVFGTGFSFALTLPFSYGGHQVSFGASIPGINATGLFYESYFLFAIPLSFMTAFIAGLVVERLIIQFLYNRKLESLLATWGVSLVMQQLLRMVFGANNVQVNSPSWLLGHFTLDDVLFGYNRVFVIAFAILIVIGTWLLLTKTSVGLLIRAVTQNREMASCMGVRTTRVNMMTFAFGSGLAGLAGAFLSQIGNVGPSMGQSYIVDSFMVVVVGGVGSIVGTVCAALGIGTADQVLQQVLGSPVLGKIIVLGTIILFLQWKPGGLFTTRSRNLDS
ncbi:MAG TPA: urea ABC transporter permease subunit UrtB [Opitutaceae bacterium]|jgi:urea transport system permease protein|nr:urea ABC transporter permease subunit UrtB [Opitutaceae bacterium]